MTTTNSGRIANDLGVLHRACDVINQLLQCDADDMGDWATEACSALAGLSEEEAAVACVVCARDDDRWNCELFQSSGRLGADADEGIRRACRELFRFAEFDRVNEAFDASRAAIPRQEVLSDDAWRDVEARRLLETVGLYDFALIPLKLVWTDRREGRLVIVIFGKDPDWSPTDDLLEAMDAVGPIVLTALDNRHLAPARRKRTLLDALSPMQQRIAPLLAEGHTERTIAELLDRSPHTIHEHAKSIYQSWNVRTRFELRDKWIGLSNGAS